VTPGGVDALATVARLRREKITTSRCFIVSLLAVDDFISRWLFIAVIFGWRTRKPREETPPPTDRLRWYPAILLLLLRVTDDDIILTR
jgi:hypothetical protein